MTRNSIVHHAAVLGILVLASTGAALAEVSIRADRDGAYLGTNLIVGSPTSTDSIWSPRRIRAKSAQVAQVLNPEGARLGDLWPAVGEPSASPRFPWVVWSRFRDGDHDLVWSRWNGQAWDPTRWVVDFAMSGSDLDPALRFDESGRPWLVWWRETADGAEVLLSFFLGHGWMTPFNVTPLDQEGRYPAIVETFPGGLVIEYETPEGTVQQTVSISDPGTITDDINPQTCIALKGEPVEVGDSRP